MSWRDQLQPASFRGVKFHVESSQGRIGRRNKAWTYPKRDKPWVEDLGRRQREFSIEAFVIGNDYMAARDALIAAVEKEGAGELIHPYLGALKVNVSDECVWRETTKDGGMAVFTLVFVEAGERQFPTTQIDSQSVIEAAVNGGLSAVQQQFNDQFTVARLPQFVADDAFASVRSGLDLVRKGARIFSAAQRRDLFGLLDTLDLNLPTLVTDGLQLAGDIVTAQQLVSSLFSDSGRAQLTGTTNTAEIGSAATDFIAAQLDIDNQITGTFAELPAIPLTTATRQQQADNRQAVQDLFAVSATLLAAQSIVTQSQALAVSSNAESPFDSYDHAIAVRDQLIAQLDALAELDTTGDPLYLSIREVQTELQRHIDAHGYTLERVVRITPPEAVTSDSAVRTLKNSPLVSLPSLAIAHRFYGTGERADDLVRRNKIRHPGFVPAGAELEVLNG